MRQQVPQERKDGSTPQRRTNAQAAREFGCYRLGARIWDLRHAGHAISKRTVTNKNRYGESVSFAEYRLEDKKC